jgi:hypothetical protein
VLCFQIVFARIWETCCVAICVIFGICFMYVSNLLDGGDGGGNGWGGDGWGGVGGGGLSG